ncbi:MAG: hypothetical protein QM501_11485 [Gimesia sp.]
MRKTGIIFLALIGISVLFFVKTRSSEQSPVLADQSANQPVKQILLKFPAQLAQTVNLPTPRGTEPDGSFERFSTEEILAKLIGKWEQTKSTRKQILTIKENGTATMVIEPQGIWRAVLGNKVIVNIEWSLKDARLTLRTVGGSPENKLEYINQLWGSEFVREINSIEDKMFTLRDDDGDVSQKWIRTSY